MSEDFSVSATTGQCPHCILGIEAGDHPYAGYTTDLSAHIPWSMAVRTYLTSDEVTEAVERGEVVHSLGTREREELGRLLAKEATA